MPIRFNSLLLLTLICGLAAPMIAGNALAQAPAPQELLENQPPTAPNATPPAPAAPVPGTIDPRITRVPGTEEETKNALPFENYSDIPDEALADMQDFHAMCQKDLSLNSHLDCDCLSSRYLEERVKAGPELPRQQILLNLSNECFNVAGAAGHGFTKCTQNGTPAYPGMSADEYCECVGRNYAIQLQNTPGTLSRRKMNSAMTFANLRCKPSTPHNRNMFKRLDVSPSQNTIR